MNILNGFFMEDMSMFDIVAVFIPICCIMIFVFTFSIIIKTARLTMNRNFFKNNIINDNGNKYRDVSIKKLREDFNTDNMDAFKDMIFKIFNDFEEAYNSLDYNMMRSLSTKQLFQIYYTGITLDLKVGNKKIINNIKRKKVVIFDTLSTSQKQMIFSLIEISYINYTMNKDGKIIRGDRDNAQTEKFEVIFRKDYEGDDVKKCPNCGAVIVGNNCEYCRTVVKDVEFKISSIKKIVD